MSTNTIYTLECTQCKYIVHISANNTAHAKSQVGACPGCAAKGRRWSTWHIR